MDPEPDPEPPENLAPNGAAGSSRPDREGSSFDGMVDEITEMALAEAERLREGS